MKFEVPANSLKESMGIVKNSLSKIEGITSHFIFSLKNSEVRLHTVNDICSSESLVANTTFVEGEGVFSIPSSKLKQWVSIIGGEEDLLVRKTEEGLVEIQSERGSIKFPSETSGEDVFKIPEGGKQYKTLIKDFSPAFFKIAKNFAHTDQKEKDLCQVFYKEGKIYASDGKSALVLETPKPVKITFGVHSVQMTPFLSFLEKFSQDQELEIYEHKGHLVLTYGGHRFCFKKIFDSSRVVSAEKTVMETSDFHTVFKKSELEYAVKYLAAVAKDKNDLTLVPKGKESYQLLVESDFSEEVDFSFGVESNNYKNQDGFKIDFEAISKFFPLVHDEFKTCIFERNVQGQGKSGYFTLSGENDGVKWKGLCVWKVQM